MSKAPSSGGGLPIEQMDIFTALQSRRSVRGFLPTPVQRETVDSILRLASRSPSASNTQPWRVHVCGGEVRERLSRALLELHDAGGAGHQEDYIYYPPNWREPYLGLRRALGKSLYRLLEIAKGDMQAMSRQYGRNYEFFGAPVGLFFTIERDLGQSAWLDLGMFLHGVMIAARGYGLDTCPQQAFARYHRVIREHLNIPDSQIVVCGMALGYADPDEPANLLVTERAPVASFARFSSF